MVTRKDVAKAAGVSPSTVSYVLSGQRPTTLETKKRVHDAIKRLGYVPNQRAGLLASTSLSMIGVHLNIAQHGVDSITADYLRGMQLGAAEIRANVSVPILPATRKAFSNYVLSKAVDAVIFMEAVEGDAREKILLDAHVPAVVLGYTGRRDGLPYVESDFEQMGVLSVRHGVENGHRNILAIMRQEQRDDFDRTGKVLLRGMRKEAQRAGVRLDVIGLSSHPSQAMHALDLLDRAGAPTMLIGENHIVTSTLIGLASVRGLKLGEDFSALIPAGSEYYGLHAEHLLTEVATDRIAMGKRCVQMVYEMFQHGDRTKVESHIFPAKVIDRGTVRPLAA